jgi:iron complex outermembrane receptor protein
MEELIKLIINRNVYSASGHNESTLTSPLSSTVLTKKDINNFGATSIEEALRLVPGVIVRQKSNGNYDLHLRGLDNLPSNNMLLYSENTNILLMIDGRPMFNYAHGANVWESLPIGFEDIDRIEIVRGPASALYGSNADNGVINIITARTTTESPLVSGSVQGGNLSTYTADLALRKAFNEKFSGAITGNFQSRKRITDEVYFFNLGGMYHNVDGDQIPFAGGFLPFKEYANLVQKYEGQDFPLLTTEDNINTMFPNSDLARENMGINGYLQYNINKKSEITVTGGFQDSYVNTSLIGDLPRSIAGRESSTGYANLNAKIGKFKLQSNYMGGKQDFTVGEYGYIVDIGQMNTSAEYDINIKSLLIRPGISYQSVFYDDSPYLKAGKSSYLNGKKTLNTLGISLRLDYTIFEKLRLISAIRSEKFNNPDDWYTSWQFAGVLPIKENQTFRAVYSRANRSSFIVNAHSNFTWDREGRTPPNLVYFQGNPNAKLMYMDMVEIGYRIQPNKKLFIDAELFASKTKDFGALTSQESGIFNIPQILEGTAPETRVYISYMNMPLEAKQLGASVNIDWIISEKLIARMHGTYQTTRLDNYSPLSRNDISRQQLGQAGAGVTQLVGGIMGGTIDPSNPDNLVPITSNWQPTDLKDDVKHESTPAFWGMAGLVYRPTSKWSIASDGYYYSEQTLGNINGTYNIDSKFILNSKIGYKPIAKFEVFVNARNLLNDKTTEFAYMDEIGGIYLVGVRFDF